MTERVLNRDLLADNSCFGCGLENPHGLQITIRIDPQREDRLIGTLEPRPSMGGFPGITHGGVIYTALDCLSTWVATVLGPDRRAAWVLRSATVTYQKPAREGGRVSLAGFIKEPAAPSEPVIVHAEARDGAGDLLVEGEFKVVPLSVDKLKRIAGLEALPDNWASFLSGAA